MPLCLSLLYNLGSRWGPRTGEEEQCCHGFILPHHVCVYIVYQILLVPVCLLSVGRKPHPCHFPECSHTVPTRTGLHSDTTRCSVFSGSLAYRVVHVLAYHSELRGGLSIKFRGLNTVPIPTHVSLLLEKLCSWHLNHGVQQLISDVFLNRIMSQNPSFSSCKHMSHLTPLKPYQIQSAREQRITYSRP